jgi:hypothetical protein
VAVRRIGFVVLALAAAIITFALAPEQPEPVNTSSYDRQISQALSDYATNDARTQGAPQQQVVNGWIARDMLTVLTQQTNELLEVSAPAASDQRIPLLLFVLILAVCWQAAAPPDPVAAGRVRTEADLDAAPDEDADAAGRSDPVPASWGAGQPERPVDDPARVDDHRP